VSLQALQVLPPLPPLDLERDHHDLIARLPGVSFKIRAQSGTFD
jgi:hypothetical protein